MSIEPRRIDNSVSPDVDTVNVPLKYCIYLQSSFRCPNVELGRCDVSFNAIKALYSAALVARGNLDKDIWESDGAIYVRTHDDNGDEDVVEIKLSEKLRLVVSFILANDCASVFELSRYFQGNDPLHAVRNVISRINNSLNPYGFFVETMQKGIYRIVKV